MRTNLLPIVAAAAFTLTACGAGSGADNASGAEHNLSLPESSAESPSDGSSADERNVPESDPSENGTPTEDSPSGDEPGAAHRQPPPDPDHCTSQELSVELGDGEGAAGTVYRPLRFTNVSDFPCVLQGFPGVSYVAGDDGHQVGEPATWEGERGAALTLRPGAVAHADIGFTQVRNYDSGACDPTDVRGLRVYPPHETASMFVEATGTGCARAEIQGSQLTVTTIEKGAGGR